MKKSKIFSRVICLLLALITVFSLSATTIFAVSEAVESTQSAASAAIDSNSSQSGSGNSDGLFESITIDPSKLPGESDEEENEENELVGDVITTEEGFRIRKNSNLESYTIVEYVGISRNIKIPASYEGLNITRIDDSVFFGSDIKSVELTENIIFVGERAFDNCDSLEYNKDSAGGCYLGTESNPYYYFAAPTEEKNNRQSVTSFTVDNDTKIIGSFAFENCKSLTEVTIGDNVKSIGYAALMQCTALKELTVPFLGEDGKNEKNAHLGYIFGARTIGGNISYVPTTLRTLTINGGECIVFNALYGIDMIESLTLPFLGGSIDDTENAYLSYVFGGESYEDKIVPQSLTSVSVVAGDIGEGAFYECVYLERVVLGTQIEKMGASAFTGCTNLTIYCEVESKPYSWDYGWNNYCSVVWDCANNDVAVGGYIYTVIDGIKYSLRGSEATVVKQSSSITTANILSDITYNDVNYRVTNIANRAFENCTSLTSVTIPEAVTAIDSSAFSGCTSLTEINFNATCMEAAPNYNVIFNNAGKNGEGIKVTIGNNVTKIPAYLFYDAEYITSVEFEEGSLCESIGDYAFSRCTSLTSITIPDSIITIDSSAFSHCTKIESVIIPNSVISIGEYAFAWSDSLNIYCEAPSKPSGWSSSWNYSNCPVIWGCTSEIINSKVDNAIEDKKPTRINAVSLVEEYGRSASFINSTTSVTESQGLNFVSNGDGTCSVSGIGTCTDTDIIIPSVSPDGDSVTSISSSAFVGRTNITSVIIPDSVTTIDTYAFSGCSGLTSLTIGEGVTNIGDYAFRNCTSLTEISFNATAMNDLSFNNRVFYNAGKDGEEIRVTIGNNVTKVPAFLFNPYDDSSYSPKITSVEFEEGSVCESIGTSAFAYCTSLTSITIPESVTDIGTSAFRDCTSLSSITIPESVTDIGSSAFNGCTSLISITIPDSVNSIGRWAFFDCTSLTEISFNAIAMNDFSSNNQIFYNAGQSGEGIRVTIGSNVTKIPANLFSGAIKNVEFEEGSVCESIGDSAFAGCTSLTSVTIPESVTSIGDSAFHSCASLTSVIVPDSVTSISSSVFYGCASLTRVTIPESVTSIGSYAFSGCTSLTSVIILDSVTTIDTRAFYNCSGLISLTIGAGVTSIGSYAFYGCASLTEINFNATAMNDLSSNNRVFYNAGKDGEGIKVTIGNNVTKIPAYLFHDAEYITSVEFEEGSVCENIGSYAFSGCASLTEINFNATAMNDLSSNNRVFYNAGQSGEGIKVTIGSNVTKIPAYLFYDEDYIISVEFEEGSVCESIGTSAFAYCTSLTSITIPESVTSIGDDAFACCYKLIEVINNSSLNITAGSYDNGDVARYAKEVHSEAKSKILNEDGYLFITSNNVNYLLGYVGNSEELILPETYNGEGYEIYDYAFYLNERCTSIILSDYITGIGKSAFYGCSNLSYNDYGNAQYLGNSENPYIILIKANDTSITSCDSHPSTKFIYSSAFSGCTSLTSVIIPDSVTSIGSSAFSGCSGLISLTIGVGVTSIESSAFSSCTSLTEINFNATCMDDLSFYNDAVFSNLQNEESSIKLIIGNNVTKIPAYLFYNVKSITSIEFEEGSVLESIGTSAFEDCTKLNSIIIPDSVTSIGSNAFRDCSGLTSITIGAGVTSIGSSAFYGCTSLTSVIIPDSVTTIDSFMFYGCTSLTSITIPENVTSIGDYAFRGCTSLTEINFNATAMNDLRSYNYVFSYAGTEGDGIKVTIGNNVTKIPAYLFYPNADFTYSPKIISVEFEEGSVLESIGSRAFYGCASLVSVYYDKCSKSFDQIVINYGNEPFLNSRVYFVHNLTYHAAVAKTCTENGNIEHWNCFACGKNYADETAETELESIVIPASHNLTHYAAVAKTCTVNGTVEYWNCFACGKNYSDEAAETELESIVIPASHNLTYRAAVAKTCTENGNIEHWNCSACGKNYADEAAETELESIVIPASHNLTYRAAAAKTCTENGNIEHWNCSDCEKNYADEAAETELVNITIPAAHVMVYHAAVEETCTENGNIEYWSCAVCEKIYSDENAENEIYSVVIYAAHKYENNICVICEMARITEGLEYILNSDGVSYTVSRLGVATDIDVIIPSFYEGLPVTAIGSYAFYYCTSLTSVTIPDSVTSIGTSAFYGCRSLTSIIIPDSVTTIDTYAFSGCSGLTVLTIGEGVTNIGDHAFEYCTSLTEINFNATAMNNLSSGNQVFSNAGQSGEGIKVTIGNNVTKIPAYLFCPYSNSSYSPKITVVEFEEGSVCESIGASAFEDCTSLISVIIPDSVTSIGSSAFEYCTSLESVIIPDSVTSIGDWAFSGCSGLISLTIGAGVTSIGDYAFRNCTSLTEINFNATCMDDLSSENRVFSDEGQSGEGIKVTIGSNVTKIPAYLFYIGDYIISVEFEEGSVCESIGSSAFAYCTSLTSVTIPDSVTSIGTSAFYGCTSLTSVTIPDSVTSIGTFAFEDCSGLISLTIGAGVTSIGDYAFRNCTSLTEINFNATAMNDFIRQNHILSNAGTEGEGIRVTIGNNVTKIPAYLFSQYSSSSYSPKITVVEFEEGSVLESIGSSAFAYCTSLTSITIPENVTTIGSYAFEDCTSLTEINFNATAMNDLSSSNQIFYNAGAEGEGIKVTIGSNVTKIPAYLFYSGDYITSIEFEEGSVLESIGTSAFYGCTSLTSVIIPDRVTSIGTDAFEDCNGLTSLTIGAGVTSIESSAFSGCTSLTSVIIPDSVTIIDTGAFYNCSGLISLTIGAGVTSIGDYAFRGCTSLISVIIPDRVTSIGNSAFRGCTSLTSLTIGEGVTNIGDYAFYGCASLTSVIIPESVTTIGSSAFRNCSGLTSLTIGAGVTSIGNSAFRGCTSLMEINFNATAMNNLSSVNWVFNDAGQSGEGIKVTIGNNVTKIPANLFCPYSNSSYSPKITVVEFEEGSVCESIGTSAFEYCTSLTSVIIPDSVTIIDTRAFYNCSGLTVLTIGAGVTSIGTDAFYGCTSLTSVIIPDSVTSIGNYAFHGCTSLTSVIIPENVTSIGGYAFYSCDSLTIYCEASSPPTAWHSSWNASYCPVVWGYNNITTNSEYNYVIHNGEAILTKYKGTATAIIVPASIDGKPVVRIGEIFNRNNTTISSVVIASSIESISPYAFYLCTNLSSITVDNNNNSYKSIDGNLYTKDGKTLIKYAIGKTNTAFTIPMGVESISENAFYNCVNLSRIVIPESVINIGYAAFKGCTGLEKIEFNANEMNDLNSDNYAFYNAGSSGEGISVIIGANVKKIPAYLFNPCSDSAAYAPKIISLEFEEGSVCTSIGSQAFAYCGSLQTIIYPGERNEWRHIKKANDWNYGTNCEIVYGKADSEILYDANEDMTEFWVSGYIGTVANDNVEIIGLYSGRPVTKIYANAFNGKSNIKSIIISSEIKKIDKNAFKNCIGLVSLNLEDGIEYIGFGIVEGCTKLESITLPFLGKDIEIDETDYIGYVFGASSYKEHGTKVPQSLKNVTVLKGNRVAANAFESCAYLESVTVPEETELIGQRAFANCTMLEKLNSTGSAPTLECIVIPDNVTRVGAEVFSGCNSLTNIYISAGLTTIDDYILRNPLFGLDKSRSKLISYTVSPENVSFKTDEYGILYRYMQIGEEQVPVAVMDAPAMADLKGYRLPEHIVEIAPYSFAYNSTLRAIELSHVRRIGDSAFYHATELIYAVFDSALAEEYANEYADYIGFTCRSSVDILNEYLKAEHDRFYASTPENMRPPFVPVTEIEVQEQFYSYIGDRAFMGCLSLQKTDIYADNIIGIGEYAFADCPALTTVNLGKNLEKLGFSAFGATASGESNLERITVASENAYFVSVEGVLYSVNSDGSLTLEIYPAALIMLDEAGEPIYREGKKLYRKEFTLPTVVTVEEKAEDGTTVQKEVAVKAIQSYAFQRAKHVEDVIIRPTRELIIGDYAFANSRILHVTLGDKVTSVGLLRGEGEYTVFADAEYLTAIDVDAGNEYYSSESGVLFDKAKQKLIKYPPAKDGDVYEVPDTVSVIASMAFKRAYDIKQVLISSEVTAIGLEAFYACTNLVLIYFDSVYAPMSIMENAFTTFVEIEDGVSYNPRTQIGYSEDYYLDGENGEYGWNNYADTYNLAAYERLPELERGNAGAGYYAVVIVDTDGNRLGNVRVSLTDPNGKTESIISGYNLDAEGVGVAMFYDLFGVEGLGFSLDFTRPYSMNIEDLNGKYRGYSNPEIYLDEAMRITYITLTRAPLAFGVSCGETEINTETADINKAQFDYPCADAGKSSHSHAEDGLICDGTMIRETVDIKVIAYCDKGEGYSFIDSEGNWLDPDAGLYQNGHKIASPVKVEDYDAYVLFYFAPEIYKFAEEVDIEVRLTAYSSKEGNEPMSCETVLNIHVYSFVVTKDDVNFETGDMDVDLGLGGDMLTLLMGSDGFSISLGKNVDFNIDIDGDTVTLELKGSKSKGGSYSSYEKGYYAVSKAHNKNTYYFHYIGEITDDEGNKHQYKYNVRFARDKESDNYYYYQCRITENGKEVERFHGAVNGWEWSWLTGKDTKGNRAAVAAPAYLIYKTHYEQAKKAKKVKGLGTNAIYAEPISKAPVQDEASYNFKVGLSGELVFKYDEEKGLYPVSSTIRGEIAVSFDWSTQFIVWIIPVIIEVGIDVNGEIELNLKFDEDRKVKLDDLMLTLGIELEAYGGIGCKAISGGFYGSVGTIFVLELAPSFGVESWEVHADVGAKVKALWWSKKFSFWSGSYYIIDNRPESVAEALSDNGASMSAAYLADTYSLARAEELESGFKLLVIGGSLYKLSCIDMSAEAGYDEYNYVKLALSKWNGAEWEEPVLLDSANKTNDAAYTVYEDESDGSVYILFTQQTKRLTEENGKDTYAGAADLAVKIAKISADGTIDLITVNEKRDSYVYLQQYAIVNGVPTVVWAENADNNMFGVSPDNYYVEARDEYHVFETTANSLWISRWICTTDEEGKEIWYWSEPELIISGLAPITDIALTDSGYLSYIVDMNSDLADSTDRVMMHGQLDGRFTQINNTDSGSVTSVTVMQEGMIYYYDVLASDSDEKDGWTYMETVEDSEKLPAGTPEQFVPVYDGEKLVAVIFHNTKNWKEDGEQMSGSAVYGIFRKDSGEWSSAIEIREYVPITNYFISELDAERLDDGKIVLYISSVNSETEIVVTETYVYETEAIFEISEYNVNYANAYVTVTVRNVGALSAPLYVSLNSGEYFMLDDSLDAGESETYTVTLSKEEMEYILKLAEDENGKDALEIEEIDLNYSDLQIFGKQMLLGGKNTLLVAIKNTGNLNNSGVAVIRLGNFAEDAIVTDTIKAQIENLDFQDEILIEITNEKGESEFVWLINASVDPGKIEYYEITLSDNAQLAEKGLISMAIIPDSDAEKGEALANNCNYVSYSELTGVLEDGETVDLTPEIIESKVAFDKTNPESITLNYTATKGNGVTEVKIDSTTISGYTVEAGEISGTLTIPADVIKALVSNTHTLYVKFADGTACTVSLNVIKYHTIKWMDGANEIGETTVMNGAAPSLGYSPFKDSDAQYDYAFVGWATVPGAKKPEKLMAANQDAIYYAVWRTTERTYTVSWILTDADGSVFTVNESYKYGKLPAYEGTVFTPEDMNFVGWDKEVSEVCGDVTYTAIYAKRYALGDISGDGVINTRDLAMLRQYVVGKITLTEEQVSRCNVYADYNEDGSVKINTRDVAVLQQYIVGSVTAFR